MMPVNTCWILDFRFWTGIRAEVYVTQTVSLRVRIAVAGSQSNRLRYTILNSNRGFLEQP